VREEGEHDRPDEEERRRARPAEREARHEGERELTPRAVLAGEERPLAADGRRRGGGGSGHGPIDLV
jgi:hypothetical protein